MVASIDVHIRLTGRGDLQEQIYRQLLEAILDGRLRSGDQLPPTRELAQRLKVARNTVAVAYERLVAEGVVIGRVGAGSFVRSQPVPRTEGRRAPPGAVHALKVWQSMPSPRRPPAPAAYDFSVGTPDPALFPLTIWRRLIASEFRSSVGQYARYGDPAGHAGLRSAIARHIGVSRAVRADAADVIVTNGAQQAFDLIARVLVSEGDCVAVEQPGYPPARLLFKSHAADVVGVPVDDQGLNVDEIPKKARVVYVTPSHQFPLGMAMSFDRRTALLAWADRRGAVIIEDDYDTEFRFGSRPLDPLQSLDRAGRVVYVGSFSKVLLPALRLGFLVAPASLQPALLAARQLTDWHGELATQAALARFIEDGLLARHIRRVTRDYAARYAQLLESMDRRLSDWLRPIPAAAGLHIAAAAVHGSKADIAQTVRRAFERGVRVTALADFCFDTPALTGLAVGYGSITASRIDEGVKRLAASLAR